MTFKEEINRFFKGYSVEQRAKVEDSPEYQAAAKQENIVKATEIAQKLLHGELSSLQNLKRWQKYK
jgi:hypothetical protein